MGSGTTGIACNILNRNFKGIEINEDYIKLAIKRFKQKGKKKLVYLPEKNNEITNYF